MHLDRQRVVRTGAFTTVALKAVLLVEATGAAILRAYPKGEKAASCGARMLDRRIHQSLSHSGPRNLLGDVDAAELSARGGDVGVWAGQHVGVPDDSIGPLAVDSWVGAMHGRQTRISMSRGAQLLRRIPFIVSLPVIAALAACEPATAPTESVAQASTSSSAPESPGDTFVWPDELEDAPELSFPSAADAIAFLSQHMDADIALPTSLPSNVRLDVRTSVLVATADGVRSAQVKLETEQGDVWGIMYGRSGLDGCAPEHSVAIRVSGQPARLRVSPDPDGSSGKWVELIWPATLKNPYGVYGLFGSLLPRDVVEMAESMPLVTGPPVVATGGC